MTDTQHGNDMPRSARLVLAVGVFDSGAKAQRVIEKLIEEDFPADRLSLLRKSGGSGDDMLGLAYTDSSEAVLTEFASALHRMGIPETRIEEIRAAIEGGKYIVILHCQPDESEHCAMRLNWAGADPVIKLPVEL